MAVSEAGPVRVKHQSVSIRGLPQSPPLVGQTGNTFTSGQGLRVVGSKGGTTGGEDGTVLLLGFRHATTIVEQLGQGIAGVHRLRAIFTKESPSVTQDGSQQGLGLGASRPRSWRRYAVQERTASTSGSSGPGSATALWHVSKMASARSSQPILKRWRTPATAARKA